MSDSQLPWEEQSIEKGQFWFIKLPDGQALTKVYVNEITPLTVTFSPNWYSQVRHTYERTSIRFVEQTHE